MIFPVMEDGQKQGEEWGAPFRRALSTNHSLDLINSRRFFSQGSSNFRDNFPSPNGGQAINDEENVRVSGGGETPDAERPDRIMRFRENFMSCPTREWDIVLGQWREIRDRKADAWKSSFFFRQSNWKNIL